MPRKSRSPDTGKREQVHLYFYDDDKDLLDEIEREWASRRLAGERSLARSDVIKDRLRSGMRVRAAEVAGVGAAAPEPPPAPPEPSSPPAPAPAAAPRPKTTPAKRAK